MSRLEIWVQVDEGPVELGAKKRRGLRRRWTRGTDVPSESTVDTEEEGECGGGSDVPSGRDGGSEEG